MEETDTRESVEGYPPEGGWLRKLIVPALVTLALSALTAAGTFIVSYIDKVRVARLDVVNKQIEKLYGPLYAVAKANDETWTQFRAQYLPSRKGLPVYNEAAKPPQRPTAEEISVWRSWMRNVFQPMNVRMEQAIVGNVQLVIGDSLPKSFLDLVAHTEGYKAVIAGWEHSSATDSSYTFGKNNLSALNYPTSLLLCAKDGYELLKARQAELRVNPLAGFYSPLHTPCSCEPSTPERGATQECAQPMSKATTAPATRD
ncbi:hypothetical protein F6X40_17570 [Paraburkholderia sp. UCT31]|uniref:hypothetical protein n=1 Tax=Paraburkholderia sp. UCT31 TaxID=2615209 RepID=UPI0016551219|nr:hypothetical protein [Paraburkholderia sp. UCT31]MBC8738570.1 hypothetical protein [Paraburkholderia sp. UCT31]